MTFLVATFSIIGIIFMLTFMFIGIWLFIVALKTYNQIRYKNYILEKISQKLDLLSESKRDFSYENFLNEEASNDEFMSPDLTNIKDFEKKEYK
ncbi:hypothetical protein [Clostridium sp.]|uniref:hypothetical protein n=1 Tax=Clostridium sp. TaxID=1506 RepID=UPI0026DAF34C|nr:hypothetical protein [Clostridium sp.]MDO5039751.1 hypothetical protein [Clostridium sp.]